MGSSLGGSGGCLLEVLEEADDVGVGGQLLERLDLAETLDLLGRVEVVLHALDGEELGVFDALGLDDLGEGALALLADQAVVCVSCFLLFILLLNMLFDVKTLPPKDLAPVLARSHLLSQWESLARLYHNYYENRKEGLYQTLDNYQASPFTRNRAFSRWFPQFQKIQIFSYAQLLGEISDQEIQFANKALGGRTLGHNQRDPALL